MKKAMIIIFCLCLQALSGHAGSPYKNATDSLQAVLETLPHDSTRLDVLFEIMLIEQHSSQNLKYAQLLFEEAKLQKNDYHLCNSVYSKILHYYNNTEEIDSIRKWVDYIKPIAERTHYWRVYFNAQRVLINAYIYNNQYEYAINEALKMQEKAELTDNLDGCIAAYQCLINAYAASNRPGEEAKILQKAYALFPKINDINAKINILNQYITYSKGRKQYKNLQKYLDELVTLLDGYVQQNPEVVTFIYNYYLFAEACYIYYYIECDDLASAEKHLKKAQTYINSQTYLPYLLTYKDAYAEYFRHKKEFEKALAINDTVLQMISDNNMGQAEYSMQLIRKADILHDMQLYDQALPLYEKANDIQDSISIAISSKQLEEIKKMYHLDQLILEEGKLRGYIQIIILVMVGIVLILCISYMLRINRIRKELKISEKETKEAASKTEEANEVKSRFLSNMSHAIRVPLNSVVGFSQLMATDAEIEEKTRNEYSNIIQKNTEQLMRLVNNVLDLSRLEANMMKYQLTDYDIIQICNDAIGSAQMQDPTLHIQFQSNVSQHIVNTDCNKIMQMIASALQCPFCPPREKEDILFTLEKTDETLYFKIINSPLADKRCAGQEASMRHEINRLLLKHFGGTYQVIDDAPEGPTILFTYPAVSTE